MTDNELIDQFERGLIPSDSFHHADHIQMAFAYLSKCRPLEALEKFVTALKRFAQAQGKPERYHETITYAYFFLIRERMIRSPNSKWEEFRRQNPDLFIWKSGVLSLYYRESTLKSDVARAVFVFPDKRC